MPTSLTAPDGEGYREHLRAAMYYQEPYIKSFGFAYYKESDVVTALNALFHNKCAYCEGKISSTGPIDIEHFRPKGRIEGESEHPGYWWLANEWTNLLASCIDCNRGRYQTVLNSEDGLLLTQGERLCGKHDHFPVAGQRAICGTDDHMLEDPLLIDPTCVDPGAHIRWKVVAEQPLAIASSQYGQTSIDLFGINRSKLAEARRELQLRLDEEFLCLKAMITNIAKEPTDEGVQRWMPALQMCINKFFRHAEPSNEYSAFAWHIIKLRYDTVSEMVAALMARIAMEKSLGAAAL
ncbi:hypothetical protein ACQJ22_12055 [Pseudomonas fragariae (ex Marin et al. 2024)]|uniref:hypothetical protein n=1 Tax=Pseudomonas TaxID=286 RepID=UPI0004480B1C|nr:hypothetical protein [Pseudomonas syringae]AKF48768.1 HNH endonuclease [Pseudomonas syringae pv. syringae B301D]EXL32081.1 hypothetical protein PssB301D_01682 [Pseudomonas syringae pv. syringae str. B301D-R]